MERSPMSQEFFALSRRSPETVGEWIAFILSIIAAGTVDSLLKKHFPDMSPKLRQGLSAIVTFIILIVYFFVIRK